MIIVRRDGSRHEVFFDVEDEPLIAQHRWHVRPCHIPGLFYAVTHLSRNVTTTMHQMLTGLDHVDHANQNGLDNRRANLRPASLSQQGANRRSFRGSSSQFKGVSWDKKWGRWTAQIRVDGKLHRLGGFTDEIEAARAYNEAAVEAWGEFARLNKFKMED